MTKKGREIFGATLGVAHGNPYALQMAIEAIATDTDHIHHSQAPLTSNMLYPVHRSIRASNRFSISYTEKSESLRSGIPGLLVGLLSWIENFASNPLLLEKPKHPRVLLVTQEHQLLPFTLMPELLRFMFPDPSRYLLHPDPIPKESAVTILKQLEGLVTPIVLTRTAASIMQEAGLNRILVKSWLIPPTQDNPVPWDEQPKVAVKTSGNGVKRNILNGLLTHCQFEYPNHIIAVSTPDRTTYIDKDHHRSRPHHTLQSAYNPIFDHGTEVVYSPASEALGISAELMRQGRLKAHHTFMLSGLHERINYDWGVLLGVTSSVSSNPCPRLDRATLAAELGTTPLSDSIA